MKSWQNAEIMPFKAEWEYAKKYFFNNPTQLYFPNKNNAESKINESHIYFNLGNTLIRLDTRKVLGEGRYGIVYEVINEKNEKFALKISVKAKSNKHNVTPQNELEINSRLAYFKNIEDQKMLGVLDEHIYGEPPPEVILSRRKGRWGMGADEFDYDLIPLYNGCTLEDWVKEKINFPDKNAVLRDSTIILIQLMEILEGFSQLGKQHTDFHGQNMMILNRDTSIRLVMIDMSALGSNDAYKEIDFFQISSFKNKLEGYLEINIPEIEEEDVGKYKYKLLCTLPPEKRRAMHYEIPIETLREHQYTNYRIPFHATLIVPNNYQPKNIEEFKFITEIIESRNISLKPNFDAPHTQHLNNFVFSADRFFSAAPTLLQHSLRANTKRKEFIGNHRLGIRKI